MPWARLDDRINQNEKLAAIGDTAYRLWTSALAHCTQNLSDGFVPESMIASWHVRGNLSRAVTELCAPCRPGAQPLWTKVESGYQVHDFLEWNDSREKVLAERERAKTRMSKRRVRPNTARSSDEVRPNTARTSDELHPNTAGTSGEVRAVFPDPLHSTPRSTPNGVLPVRADARTPGAEETTTEAELKAPLQVVIDRYYALFVQHVRKKPHLTGRDTKIFKDLIAEQGLDDVLAALEGFFVNEYAQSATFHTGLFANSFNKYRGGAVTLSSEDEVRATERRLREAEAKWSST